MAHKSAPSLNQLRRLAAELWGPESEVSRNGDTIGARCTQAGVNEKIVVTSSDGPAAGIALGGALRALRDAVRHAEEKIAADTAEPQAKETGG